MVWHTISFNTASGKYYCNMTKVNSLKKFFVCFNTASGKYYCNSKAGGRTLVDRPVSIPQAVSTIAMSLLLNIFFLVYYTFQYRKR